MVEKDTVIKEKIKFAGYAKFDDVYNFAYGWWKNENFNVVEEQYTEKVKGNAKELDVVWTATKKITDYFKAEVNMKWKILGMEDVEVEVDGKKKKTNKFAELSIEIKGIVVKDYDNKWNATATTKFFKEVYNKYVIPGRNEEMKDKVENFVRDFKQEVKALLELTGKR